MHYRFDISNMPRPTSASELEWAEVDHNSLVLVDRYGHICDEGITSQKDADHQATLPFLAELKVFEFIM